MPRRNRRMAPTDADLQKRRDLDDLFAATYQELKRLASFKGRSFRIASLNTTSLLHEAWLKLQRSPELGRMSRLDFVRIAGEAMRQVLVEAARRQKALKRGGEGTMIVPLEGVPDADVEAGIGPDVIALDRALDELARVDRQMAWLVEARFFAGMTVGEIADLLGVSKSTVERDWTFAKAWLADRIGMR